MNARIQEFDFSVNLLRALLWQYEEATNLRGLLFKKADWYTKKQTEFWENWERDVFNLETANDFGLSVWSIILNIPLYYGIAGTGPRGVWGFGQYNYNFTGERPPLDIGYNFGRDSDAIAQLSTEQKRLVLKLRYYQITSDGTVPDVNRMLNNVFGDMGPASVIDPLDMSEVTYALEFVPTSAMVTVLERFDVLPRPAGVGRKVLINPRGRFGFKPYYLNFENSNFGGEKLRDDIPPAP